VIQKSTPIAGNDKPDHGEVHGMEQQLTHGPGFRVLTHCNVFSPCGQWIAYDTRSALDGSRFDGTQIRIIHRFTGEDCLVYESQNGACCGVVTWHPHARQVALILGPEHPTADWSYAASRRRGVIVEVDRPGIAANLDACDLARPRTAGALSGGSHVHIYRRDGERISFTYEDEYHRDGLRTIAVARPGEVNVPCRHPRNHDGSWHCQIAATVTASPIPGSDEINRACEESWLGVSDAVAFQGTVIHQHGQAMTEVFISEIDWASGNDHQRRLTRTESRRHPGIRGPRHWLKSNPEGTLIGTLMLDDDGIVQFTIVPVTTGIPRLITNARIGVQSAFTWSPCGLFAVMLIDDRISQVNIETGAITPLSPPSTPESMIRPEAVAIAPDGATVAYLRTIEGVNQIMIAATR
jgi:hypothetical protein